MLELNLNVNVVLVEGISKKTGKPYNMLKVITGNNVLDYTIKPLFIDSFQAEELKKLVIKG